MDDDCDFAAVLKELDELDARHYSSQISSIVSSDFDQSEEDLASLLGDDDEDILKKTFSSSPAKKKRESLNTSDIESAASHSNTRNLRKDSKVDLQNSFLSKTSPKRTLPKSHSKEIDDSDPDALNDLLSDTTLPSFRKKSLPIEDNQKEGSQIHSVEAENKEEEVLSSFGKAKKTSTKSKDSFYDSFFKNLSSPKDSPEKSSASSSLNKKEKVKDDDEDILDSLKSDKKIASQKRKDSYLDSFLKNISPKTSPKKNLISSETRRESIIGTNDDTDEDNDDDDLLKSLESDEEKSPIKRKDSYAKDGYLKRASSPKTSPKKFATIENKQEDTKKIALGDDDEDIFGKSPSLETKKSNPPIQKHSTPDKRKTFVKQVSFKGIPDNDSPENTFSSPKHQPVASDSATKPKPPKRSERMGVSNKDDTDWLNFFKESPKNAKTPTETQVTKNIFDDKPKSGNLRSVSDRRRSSNAEWLGLNESDIAENNAEDKLKGAGDWEPGGPVELARPQGTPAFSNEKMLVDDPGLSWLSDSKGILKGRNNKTDNAVPSFHEKKQFESVKMVNGDDRVYAQTTFDETGAIESVVVPPGVSKKTSKQSKVLTPFSLQSTAVGLESQSITNVSSDVSAARGFPTELESLQSLANSQNVALSLQPDINNYLLERDQLLKSTEIMKQMYEERIKTLENLHKNEVQSLEETIKITESKLKTEMQSQLDSKEAKLNDLQSEKKQIENDFRDKIKESEKQNLKEIERLKELHGQSLASMKQDHEDALLRLNRLKEQEIAAVLSSQTYSKSLQNLTEQLEARASELASLQSRVEERNQATMKEKQALLENKERDLKNLQCRVERQLEEGDSERSRLQQLVLRLESRLQKYTTEGEEDRWEVQQMKARLSVQQKHLDEEYKLQLQQVEREKEKLRLAQDSLLHEQKTVLMQLAQERQQLMREKIDMESVAKKLKEEENIFHIKKMKEESYLESQKQFLQQEENRLRNEKNNAKQEADMLAREQESLQRERHLLNEEKLKINEFNFKLKRRETEVEMLAMSAAEDKERAQVDHALTIKTKNEQQSRVQEISSKLQEAMEKEQQILTEKEKLSEERLDLENKKKTIVCNKCKLSLGIPINAPPLPYNTAPTAVCAPVANLPITNSVSNSLEDYRRDPSLIVWYITAQRDREYLQEELAFLKSLKDSSTTRKRL
ncbi:hypothetical protein JTE90_017859 [Oedothorax gibbosus]|uniref:Fas-binding factor 1 C-terminal domain-containing protein n=1 Tax=Oedothorax gibbosus TaxID=931172 RepID=A0AAV6V265_9ARAC|nr:hypothetical protein JTE90_017859 [Oedothorax gibbosus]